MTSKTQLALGAFFIAVLGILGYFTLFMSDFSLFQEKHDMVVHFPDADGLREGDTVLVAGMRRGRVSTLTYDPSAALDRRITVALRMDEAVPLREGFTIHIEDATMLGGKLVVIDPGPAGGAGIATEAQLFGAVKPSALAGLGDLIAESRGSVNRILGDVETVVGDLRGGEGVLGRLIYDQALSTDVTAGLSSISATFTNLEDVTERIRGGEGVLGRLVTDDELAGKLGDIAGNLGTITDDFKATATNLKEGRGTLGRLMNDEAMAEDVSRAVARLEEIVTKINAGEGTLGRLVTDEAIARHIESILAKADSGEGLLGQLLTNEEVFAKLDQVASDLATVSATLREGRGTMGRLLMDEALYDQLQQAVNVVTLSLEEYREAAPISTFTSVLFGAF